MLGAVSGVPGGEGGCLRELRSIFTPMDLPNLGHTSFVQRPDGPARPDRPILPNSGHTCFE